MTVKVVLIGLLSGFAGSWLFSLVHRPQASPKEPPEVIEAQAFVVVSEDGSTERARLDGALTVGPILGRTSTLTPDGLILKGPGDKILRATHSDIAIFPGPGLQTSWEAP